MHFSFLVGNHYLTQGKHYCNNFLRSIAQVISENKNKKKKIIQHDQSCQKHTLGRVPKDLLNDIISFIYYFLRCGQFH